MKELSAKKILKILESKIPNLGNASYKFLDDTTVEMRFYQRNMSALVKIDLDQLKSAHVSPFSLVQDVDDSQVRPISITVSWKPLSDQYMKLIENDIRFLIAKYKMVKE